MSTTLMEDRHVDAAGIELFTRHRPGSTQPPLVLITGIGGSLDNWAPLLPELGDRDVYMIDLPGCGRSGLPSRPIRMSGIADHVAAGIRALGLERVDLLGVSFGGGLVQELTHRHPTLIRRLIVVGTSQGIGAKPAERKVLRALMSSKRYSDRALAEKEIPLIAGGRTARDPAVLAAGLDERLLHPPSKRGYRYQLYAITGWSSRRWLSQLTLPVLVLHGDEDPAVPVSNAHQLAEKLPNAQLSIVPGAGHLLLFDEPEKAAAAIEPFLSA